MILTLIFSALLSCVAWFFFFNLDNRYNFKDGCSSGYGAACHFFCCMIFMKMGGWLVVLPLLSGLMLLGNFNLEYKANKQ
jgi:hypothetical protein